MKKIVAVIKPFVIQQNIFVYEDGNKIDVLTSPLNDIQNTLIETADKYQIENIDILGSKKYYKVIVNKIKELELTKYNENKLIINLI